MIATAVLAASLALSGQAGASWVTLVKTDGSVPASWSGALQDAAKKSAKKASDVQYMPPPQVSIEDAQLALGCTSWGPACVGQIAGMMSADAALLVELEKRGDGAWLTHQLISASGGVQKAPVRFELPDRGKEGLKVARVVVGAAVTGSPVTVLSLKTDVAGADVIIDGKKAGKTPLVVAGSVSPGEHTIEFRMDERAPVTRKVRVESGKITHVGVVLASAAAPPPVDPTVGEDPIGDNGDPSDTPPDDTTPGGEDTGGVTGGGGGLDPIIGYATLGAGLGVAVLGGGLLAGHYAVAATNEPDPCKPGESPAPGVCETQAQAYERLQRDGESIQATMSTLYASFIVAEVVAGVLVVAGAGLTAAAFLTADAE
jgi:hypothetical protein